MKHILALLFLLLSGLAQAADYYVCDCGTGAEGSCVAGSSGGTGTTSGSPKQFFSQLPSVNGWAAGSTVRFCRGGSHAWTLLRLENPNATKANPITFDAYTPSWGGTARPILFTNPAGTDHGSASAFEYGGFFDGTNDVGYTFRNIHVKGPGKDQITPGQASRGWLVWGLISNTIYDNVEVDGFTFGFQFSNGADGGNPDTTSGHIVRNSYIHHNSMGILGSRHDLTIDDNTLERNNDGCSTACSQSHALYIATGRGYAGTSNNRIRIRRNVLRDNSFTAAGNCEGGSMTMHGRFDDILIEENLVETTTGTPNTGCYGISLNEGYLPEVERLSRLVVRGNTVANVGNVCIESNIGGGGAIYENNKCIKTRAGGQAPNINLSLTDNADSITAGANANNTIVRNNTFYVTVAASGSLITVNTGTGHSVYNNLAFLGGAATANCWGPTALSNFTVWDHNHCYELGSGQWSTTYATLSAAQAAGFDTSGSAASFSFANTPASPTWDLSLSANIPGRATGKPPRDALWCQRATTPTRGAVEFSPSSCSSIRSPINF